jgi:adenine-specific DNA-methyltransferase
MGRPHVLIEGDNLHALTVLQATHAESVDVIYIDPPYNTGKEFIYNDKLVGIDDRWRHSAWLSFMSKRLRLAHALLNDTGLVFISIDDNEQAHLRLLCDQVFGAGNFIGLAPRKTRSYASTKGNADLQTLGDYLLIYARDKSKAALRKRVTGQKTYPHEDGRGRYYTVPLNDSGPHGYQDARPNLHYAVFVGPEGQMSLTPKADWKKVLPPLKSGREGCWMWGKAKFERENEDLVEDGGKIFIKHYYNASENQDKTQAEQLWLDALPNALGTKSLTETVGKGAFSYPKPVELVAWCVSLHPNVSAIVLDFFAGSGTTTHAVAQLNAADGGSRQAIVVTNNENDICRSVTQPRVKAVLTGKWADGQTHDALPGSLRFYRTDFLPKRRNRDQELIDLARAAVDILALKESSHDVAYRDEELTMLKGRDTLVALVPNAHSDHGQLVKRAAAQGDADRKVAYLFTWSDRGVEDEIAAQWHGWYVQPLPTPILAALRRSFNAARSTR